MCYLLPKIWVSKYKPYENFKDSSASLYSRKQPIRRNVEKGGCAGDLNQLPSLSLSEFRIPISVRRKCNQITKSRNFMEL